MTAGSIIRPTVRPLIRGISEGKGGGGAGITILSSVAAGIAQTATPLTIDVPVGTQDGMAMLLYVFVREDTDLITVTNWTEINALTIVSVTGDDRRAEVHQRTASSEPATYDIDYLQATGRRMVAVMLAIDGADGFDVTPIAAHTTTAENNNNPDTISITTLTEGAVVLNGMCFTQNPSIAIGEPSGNTLLQGASTATFFTGAVSFVQPASPGAVAAIPWNNTAADAVAENITNVIALKAA